MKKFLALVALNCLVNFVNAQSLAINTDGSLANASAMLDIKNPNKGILIPRTSSTTRIAIPSPAKGLLVYDTTTNSFWYHNGTIWTEIGQGSGTAAPACAYWRAGNCNSNICSPMSSPTPTSILYQ